MINIAVMGSNFITDKFIDAVNQSEGITVNALYSRTQERANEYGQKWNIPNLYTNFDDMLLEPNIDAVYIATPNKFHYSQALSCLKAGKHVICEKPISLSVKELNELLQTAEKNNVIIMEALRTHFVPAYKQIINALPKLGKIRRAVFSYCQYSSRYDKFKNGIVENAFNPKLGNGALTDIGVYVINAMVMLMGEPKSIKATGEFLRNSIDAYGTILAKYNDMQAVVNYSKVNNSFHQNEIQGEKACLLYGPLSAPEYFEIRYNNGEVERFECELNPNDLVYEVEYFVWAIKNEKSIKQYQDYSKISIKILEEARKQIGINFN